MNILRIACAGIILFSISCNNAEKSGETTDEFDIAKAGEIIEKRNKKFQEAVKVGDSTAVGELYTLDTKVGNLIGRQNVISEFHAMHRDSITGMNIKILNLWGDGDVIVEDAFVEFFHANGRPVSKGNSLFIWKKEGDTWRIYRDIYMPVR